MVAEDLGVATGGCGVMNQTGEVATLANEVAGEEAALAGGGSGCGLAAILEADLDMADILNVDSGCDIQYKLSSDELYLSHTQLYIV